MRLIDADALKEKLLKERDAIPLTYTERYGFGVEFLSTHGQARRGGVKAALRCMEQTPTIDAVPVVHGRWLPCGFGKEVMCSVCGCELGDAWEYRHCPDCGAKMDLKEV